MAAQRIPPSSARASGTQTPATAIERVFERKVRLSKWALLFEQLWPRAWLVLGLVGLFIGASLAGLWPRLPELRVGRPSPRTDRYDPFALRALLLLSVFVLLVAVGDSASDRLRSAFRL